MRAEIVDMVFSFSLFSILGWLLEVAYRSLGRGRLVNPGLLKGPYLILYGTGALCLMEAASLLHGRGLAVKIPVYLALTTGLELLSAFLAQSLFERRLWDYSDEPFNYKGHVCLRFSLYWLLLALGLDYVVLPGYRTLLGAIPHGAKALFGWLVTGAMTVELLWAFVGRSLRVSPEERARFEEIARPVLEIPEVARLNEFTHHRKKTRLEHVKEVAYISFICGRRLGLDCEAIVRGALLHDLFFYDWLHEGPRLHGLRHHNIALENARRITRLSPKEEDIIKKHMWPLTVVPPLYLESLVVSLADTFCSARDYLKRPSGAKALAASEGIEVNTPRRKG